MEIRIIRKEYVKPQTPTPPHLRTYQLSSLDQLNEHFYVSLIYFYPSSDQTNSSDSIASKLSRLRESGTKALVHYYPFAGRLSSDGNSVDCNDQGAYYAEAEVIDYTLDELLAKPDSHLLNQLTPFHDPSLPENIVCMGQANVFKCGGIALTCCSSHRVADGPGGFFFKTAWAAISSGSTDFVVPRFVAQSLFPQDPLLPTISSFIDPYLSPQDLIEPDNCVSRRLVFDSQALSALKARASSPMVARPPSRFEVVVALIWSRAMAVLRQRNGSKRRSVLSFPVDLRRRMVPPLPSNAFGNLFLDVPAVCNAEESQELQRLVGIVREASAKIDNKYIEKLQSNFMQVYRELWETACGIEEPHAIDYFACSNGAKSVTYELDFGWGKPKWVCTGQRDVPWLWNSFHVVDSQLEDGVEAWVNMEEQDMADLEKDPVLLLYASVDPCPLPVQGLTWNRTQNVKYQLQVLLLEINSNMYVFVCPEKENGLAWEVSCYATQ